MKQRVGSGEHAALGDSSLAEAMSQVHRQVSMSQQRALQNAQATISNATPHDVQVRLPQHHQVAPIAPALSIPAHAFISSQAQQLVHLQRLPNMQQHAFNMYRPPLAQETTFKDKKLRSGKWTPEEEAYADILIELFVKGQVDLENGSTLRSFLAKKLHCAPMRVTKKYAGKSKGKASYLGKKNSVAIDPVGYQRNLTRLQTAKKNFLKAVYPEMSVTHKAIPLGIVPLLPNPNSNTPSWPQYSFPTSNLTVSPNAASYAVVSRNPAVEMSSRPRPSISMIGGANRSQLHSHPPQPSASNSNIKSQTLHESFLKAVQKNSVTQAQATSAPTVKPHPVKLLHNAYVTATEATGMPPPSSFIPAATISAPPPSHSAAIRPKISKISISGNVPQASEMPDFLKGFDEVTGMEKSPTPGASTSDHHTPTFTSKSFDDFHRFLGVDISPLNSQQTANGKPANQSVPFLPGKDMSKSDSMVQHRGIPGIGMGRIQQQGSGNDTRPHRANLGKNDNPDLLAQAFTEAMSHASSKNQPVQHLGADYYTLFAQQTALAASQHSAYMGGPKAESTHTHVPRGPTTVSRRKSALVSEPPTTSGSDRGTEESDDLTAETTWGSSDTASSSNDSDGTNSESSRKRKKARMSRLSPRKRMHGVQEKQTAPSNNCQISNDVANTLHRC
ncbi:unnamed protein product [Cylindrotheca closterium]|uniref:Uncharacterized protein n=1 Tax=Cylindrotheca closterium TaxID=2856 RepID=A0AAD2FU33_9STRA|nr:unnamed protein product [Cylindrotheca closterium]